MVLPDSDPWALLEPLHYIKLRHLQDSVSNETITSNSPTNSTHPLKNSLIVYGSLFALGFTVYCYVRKRIPRTYAVRQWVTSIKTPLADNQFGYVSWVWKVYSFSADELIETVGLDGLCFLRLMSMGFRFACVGACNSIWLFPVYATATKDPASAENVVNYLSFNLLQDGSPRFIATVMAAYVFFGYVMYTMLREFSWFNEQRYNWLRRFKQQNYSILVRNIPKDLRSNNLLLGYFQSVYGSERVLEAHVCIHMADLEAMVKSREACIGNLEHALAEFAISGRRPRHLLLLQAVSNTVGATQGESEVDSINYYTAELDKLNQQINEQIDIVELEQGKDVMDLARVSEQQPSGSEHWREKMGHSNAAGIDAVPGSPVGRMDLYNVQRPIDPGSRLPTTSVTSSSQEITANEPSTSESTVLEDHQIDGRGSSVVGSGVSLLSGVIIDPNVITPPTATISLSKQETAQLKSSYGTGQSQNITTVTGSDLQTSLEARSIEGNAGFVTFTSLLATQAALQMNHRPELFAMETEAAPDPPCIFWSNIDKSKEVLQTGRLLSVALTMTICFFWTFVVTFIVNLTNVDEVASPVAAAYQTLESNPWIQTLLSLVSPLLLTIFNSGFLPVILKAISRLEFPSCDSSLEASAFWKMAAFTIIQTFFVSLITGSIVQELSDLLESPKEFIALLASALPQQSVFFMQLLIVSTTVGTLNELFRVVPVFYSIVRAHIGRRLTKKERNEKVGMFRALSNVDKCYYSRLHSSYLLYFIVLYVYTTISPLVNWFCLIFFCFVGSVYRHQFVFNYPNTPDSGGKIWLHFMEVLLACMVIAQLTIGGFLGLKKATIALPMLIPLFCATIYFIIYVRSHHFMPGRFLAASCCIAQDAANKDRGANFNEFSGEYKQPTLRMRFLDVDWNAGRSMDNSNSDHFVEAKALVAENEDEENVTNNNGESPVNNAEFRRSLGPRELLVRMWSIK